MFKAIKHIFKMRLNLSVLIALTLFVAAIAHGHEKSHHGDKNRRHHKDHDINDSSSSSSSSEESKEHDDEDRHSKKDHDDDDHHDDHGDDHDKIWFFHIGDNFGAYEFIDPTDGALKGFHVDLLRAVCTRAKKRCHYILDNYENCWQTKGGHEYPGVGLLDEYYDGCLGLYPTVERKNSFNFTEPYTTNLRAVLVFRDGEAPKNKDVTGKKIGFVSGWAISRTCLARQSAFKGNRLGEYTAAFYENQDKLVAALKNKEVDAILTADHVISTLKEPFDKLEPAFVCTLGGLSVMTRYGSDLINWWNKAFEDLVDNGEFRKLCVKAEDAYGTHGQVNCLL